jgi:hypothetical protein
MLTSGINTLIEHLTAHVLLYPIPEFFPSGAFNAPNTQSNLTQVHGGLNLPD